MKPIKCSQCGENISEATATMTDNLCMICYLVPDKSNSILNHKNPSEDVLISFDYERDSWEDDISGWIIQVNNTGMLRQVVKYSIDYDDTEAEQEAKQLSKPTLQKLKSLIGSCDEEELQAIESRVDFDDVDMVSLNIPKHDINVYLQYYFLQNRIEHNYIEITPSQQAGFEYFSELWNLIDTSAPVSVPASYIKQGYDEMHQTKDT